MPAMLDDPTAPVIYRTSGAPPYPTAYSTLPLGIGLRHVTLRDRITTATLVPFSSPHQVPLSLLSYLCDQLNREIEQGDTYPMTTPMSFESFGPYWFANFGAVMLLGELHDFDDVHRMARENCSWEKECLGSFYIKPNYPGRSSHVCNGGFLVTGGSRNRGVGRLMGEGYLEWAPKLGYTYSVFNLVYETNVVSCRIWDALGFKRIGRVKGCGNLRSYPGQPVDALIYGRDLGPEGEDHVVEERFDRIKFYLKNGTYPNGADRAEKSRLRSAATHYKLISMPDGEDKLMLKGKEVITDSQEQYEIAKSMHAQQHGGINKTTANIAEKYHWVRIKETVSLVIRNCQHCKDLAKGLPIRQDASVTQRLNNGTSIQAGLDALEATAGGMSHQSGNSHAASQMPMSMPMSDPKAATVTDDSHLHSQLDEEVQHQQSISIDGLQAFDYDLPVDPAIMDGIQHQFPAYSESAQEHLARYPQHIQSRDFAQSDAVPDDYSASHNPGHQASLDGRPDHRGYLMHQPYEAAAHSNRYQPDHSLASQGQTNSSLSVDPTSTGARDDEAMLDGLSDTREAQLARQLMNAGYGTESVHNQYNSSAGYTGGR